MTAARPVAHVVTEPRDFRQYEAHSVREAAFRVFELAGVDRIFGNPGSTELPMFRNLPETISYHVALLESVALGMADGYAQMSGRPAVVSLHSASGVGHAAGSLFTAFRNQTPMVIIAGQQ